MDTQSVINQIKKRNLGQGLIKMLSAYNQQFEALCSRLETLSDSQRSEVSKMLSATKLYSNLACVMLWVLLGGFGANRFYIGDIGIGLARLGYAILYFIIFALTSDANGVTIAGFKTLINILVAIWWIWFFVDGLLGFYKLYRKNYAKINEIIDNVEKS